jgi:hypothetical protein
MFVFVERDFECPVKAGRNTAQRSQAGEMLAVFKPGNHGFGHSEADRELLLRLTTFGAQGRQLLSKTCGERNCGVDLRVFTPGHNDAMRKRVALLKLSTFAMLRQPTPALTQERSSADASRGRARTESFAGPPVSHEEAATPFGKRITPGDSCSCGLVLLGALDQRDDIGDVVIGHPDAR